MSVEITSLLLMLLLLVILMVIQGAVTIRNYGLTTGAGPRDDVPFPQPGLGGRVFRTIQNHKEGLLLFIPLVLLTAILEISNDCTVWGAQLFAGARFAYVPCYLLGIPWVRTGVFAAGMTGLVLLVYGLFQ